MLSNEEIEHLVRIPKSIDRSYKYALKEIEGHRRTSFTIQSTDNKHTFTCFIRQNQLFEENFSVGLLYNSKSFGNVFLMRCNGPHGLHITEKIFFNDFETHREKFHIHKITEDNLQNNTKAKGYATDAFNSLLSAIYYLLRHLNVNNIIESFPNYKQLDMFENN